METAAPAFLTPKQQLFCDEYLTDMNATAAALRAGYSATTALNGALMRMPKIKAYLNARCIERADKLHIDQEMILRELATIAFSSMENYFDIYGKPRPMEEISGNAKSALAHVKIDDNGTVSMRTYNKLTALDRITKLMRFYEPIKDEPKYLYVYLDKDKLTPDDKFEDDSLDAEAIAKAAAEEKKRKEDEYRYVDKDGNPIFANPLPYGPMAEVYPFDIHDSPDQIIAKLNVYESLQKPVAEYAEAHGLAGAFKPVDIRTQFSNWLEIELCKLGTGGGGNSDEYIWQKYDFLRGLIRDRNEAGTLGRKTNYSQFPDRIRKMMENIGYVKN